MDLNDKLRAVTESWGADFYGVADLAPAHDAILEQGGPVVAAYPRAISVGIALPNAIVDQLPQRANRAIAINYKQHGYEIVSQRLDQLTSQLASQVQRAGFGAWPVPAARRVDDARLYAIFSNKMAAHLAGLGWIGKSCLLVTPQAGPRVRWATVLTEAPLPVTGQPMAPRCGTCRACVDICPVQAFTGEPFRASEPREKRYDAHKCERYFDALRAKDPEAAVCGLCLYVCPHGRKTRPDPTGL